MNSFGENNTSMNFYASALQSADSQSPPPPPLKRHKCYNDLTILSRRDARILGRRYALTPTSYKYLDVAIRIGPVVTVDLVLGDNRGTEFVLPIATWRAMLQRREEIEDLIGITGSSPIRIRDMKLEVVTVKGKEIIKFSLLHNTIRMMPSTLMFLLNLENCIDHMYSWLCTNTPIVASKFDKFVTVVRHANVTDTVDVRKVIRESNVFDIDSIIDCELLAFAINNIVCTAQNN